MSLVKSLALAAGLLVAGSVVNAASAAVITDTVNVRSGPGTNYAVIGSLPAGARVSVGGCTGNWCRVGGGWVSASFIAGGGTSVVVTPNYADDVALGVGAFALGAAVGSAWDDGWGWGYGPGWGYYGPGWGWGPGWRRPYWRSGYWGPGWNRPGWNRPGWNRPGWNRPGWAARPGWRARPAYWGGGPRFRGPVYRAGGFRGPAFRAGGFGGRPMFVRSGGFGRRF